MTQRDTLTGGLLLALGLILLIGPQLNLGAYSWPLYVIAPGAALLFLTLTNPTRNAPHAIPGAVITTAGLILLTLQLINRTHAWAYAWTLLMAAAGAGTSIYATQTNDLTLRKAGRRTTITGLLLFAGLALLFELVIFRNLDWVLRWLIPALLLAAGALITYRATRKPQTNPNPHQ